jgi:2-deoxy-D-gluconate 3-dehydrogenase
VDNPFDLSGKLALVTGAGRGIGRECALALARAGADLAVSSRTSAELESLAAEARALGRRAEVFLADARDVQQLQSMVERVLARFGRIDVLLNNAGTNVNQSVLEVTEDAWDLMMDVNLKAAFFCAQAAARAMVAQGGGKIVNMGSTFSVVGMAGRVPYCASKGGLMQLTRAMAVELAPRNVQVNAVGPTATETVMNRELFAQPDWREMVLGRIPAGRFARPEDVVGAVVYLASAAADMVTGQIILIDGGWTAQ